MHWNAFLTIPSSWTAELVARSGFDSVTIDMQHGLMDFQTALHMLQAISGTPATPFVRLPWNDPAVIMHVLDAGAAGVICPGLNTKEEVEAFIGACRYPPLGFRSIGPIRAVQTYGPDYVQTANEKILALPMIETAQAAAALESFLEVPGVSGLFIGPYDLSVSMGLSRLADIHDPALSQVIHRVLAACKTHEKLSVIYTGNPVFALELAEMGFDIVCYSSDSGMLEENLRHSLGKLRTFLLPQAE